MTVEPLGTLSAPAKKLRRMISLSTAFQAAGGWDDAESALEHVFLRNALGDPRPYAVIAPGQMHEYRLIAGGGQNYLRPQASLDLFLAINTSSDYYDDPVQAEFEACNFFGGVIDDLAELAGADDADSDDGEGHLPIVRITLVGLGEIPEEHWQSLGRFYTAQYTIEWGDG